MLLVGGEVVLVKRKARGGRCLERRARRDERGDRNAARMSTRTEVTRKSDREQVAFGRVWRGEYTLPGDEDMHTKRVYKKRDFPDG